jgi:hypothetical protein
MRDFGAPNRDARARPDIVITTFLAETGPNRTCGRNWRHQE